MEEIVDVENREITIVDRRTGEIQVMPSTPEDLLVAASEAAKALERVIELNDRPPLMFNGKRYLEFHHWMTIAKFYHVTVRTSDPEFVEIGGVQGFKAKAEALDEKTGTIVGGAEAYCMRDESNWKSKPTFQLASMAQTRAASKALSNKFRFVAVVAGYEGTPSEEMSEVVPQAQIKTPQEKKPEEAIREAPKEVQRTASEEAKAALAAQAPAPMTGEDLSNALRPPESKFFAQLHAIARTKKVSPEKMKQAIEVLYSKTSSKDLTDKEAADLIKMIEKGAIK